MNGNLKISLYQDQGQTKTAWTAPQSHIKSNTPEGDVKGHLSKLATLDDNYKHVNNNS